MNAKTLLVLLLQSVFALLVRGTIYIIKPLPGTICSGGKPCTVEWLDDGAAPLLSDVGPCHVTLYNGNQIPIQQINPVDVSAQHALTFVPDPRAGPNSDLYYINFTSVRTKGSRPYSEFSAMFTLDSMTGSFSNPIPSDTSAIPLPSSLLSSTSNSLLNPTVTPTPTPTTNTGNSTTTTIPTSDSSSSGTTSTSTIRSSSSTPRPASSTPTNNTSLTLSNSDASIASSSSLTSSGFTTSRTPLTTTTATTLTVPASASGASTGTITTPSDPPSASDSSTVVAPSSAANQPSAASRTVSMPLFLSSVFVFAFALVI